jgi:Peptidase A4 family
MHRRSPRLPVRALLATVPVLGLALAAAPAVMTASPAAAASQPAAAQATAAARSVLQQLAIGQHDADHRAGVASGPEVNGLTQVQSTNWSGYADDSTAGASYTTVKASWTEPSATCSGRTTSLAAFWVGIDGYSSSSVEQDGTLVECYQGTPYYYTWWEMYPSNAIQVVGSSLSPGDAITAAVTRSGSSYTLTVTDSTHTANSFTTTQSCSGCANSSAEWIAEAPSGSSGVYPLSNFHSWTATGASVSATSSSGVISSFPDDEITMIDSSGLVKAQPGALGSGGSSFSVAWDRSS